MKNFVKLFVLSIILGFFFSGNVAADTYSKTISVFKQSNSVQPFFKDCYGYAVFPTVGKGGIGIGGAYGTGNVYKSGKVTGTTSLTKLSIGFQLGGQAFSQIIFFQDKRSYGEFISGNFEFDASASAVAITAGAQAKAGTEGATAGASAGPCYGRTGKSKLSKGNGYICPYKRGIDV